MRKCKGIGRFWRFATVRDMGALHERRGLVDALHFNRLPLVPLVLRCDDGDGQRTGDPSRN